MRRKAEALVELVPTFPKGRARDGIAFVIVPSSTDPLRIGHRTNGIGCTCAGFNRRGVCTHQLAVAAVQQRQEAARIASAQPVRKSAQQLYAEAGPYGPCISKSGCDQPAGGKSRLCGRHLDALLDQLGA
jgi:hypothetical protein